MYARLDSPKYLCRACNNKIPIADLENIFHEELKDFFANPQRLATSLQQAEQTLREKDSLVASHQQNIQKVREEMHQTHQSYLKQQISAEGFGDFYRPAEARLNQFADRIAEKLQAEVDLLKVNRLSAEDILAESQSLYQKWPSLPIDDRRKISEAVCEKIVIGKDEIDITLSCSPPSEELCKSQTLLCGRGT